MNRSFVMSIRSGFAAGVVASLVSAVSIGLVDGAPQRAPAPTAAGVWEQVDDDGRVGGWFHIYEREGVYQGSIVKMFLKPGDKPNPICTKCPGDQKNQPTLGLTLIKGMQRKGRNYENGTILDPRDGSIYQARMELSPDGQKLMVRGFLGIDLFGQSQIWRRLPDSALAQLAGSAAGPGSAAPPNPQGSGSPAPNPEPGASNAKGSGPQTGNPPAKR